MTGSRWRHDLENRMWAYLSIALLAAALLTHLWWRKRFLEAKRLIELQVEEIENLRSSESNATASFDAQRQALFNSMVEGVLVADSRGRIQLVNDALKTMMNVSAKPLGQTIIEAFRLHEVASLAERALAEHQVVAFDFELQGPQHRSLQVNAAAVRDSGGDGRGVILVFHDLTRIKRLENTRREFVANVSHELRTPLSLIKGSVETLIDGAKDDPAAASRFLQVIMKHSDRLACLIDDLLTISELESGQAAINPRQVEIHSLVNQVCDDLRAKADLKSIRLQNEAQSDLLARADPDRIQQVLFNLLDNAIKYGRPGGFAKVQTRLDERGMIEIRIEDDGPGIPQGAVDRVFERFFRLDRARSREQGGTGLGLSIVKHIVQAHSGEVWVRTEAGSGSVFFFTLPPA